jgi:hypothetical protein
MRILLGSAVLCFTLATGTLALAAKPDQCPEGATCYSGHVLEFNPDEGPVQFLVVKSTSLTTTTLDGQSVAGTATLVEFASDGDRYTQRGDPLPPYPKVGVLANANTGDTFGLAEITGADQH